MSKPVILLTFTGLPDYYSGSSKTPVSIIQTQGVYTAKELADEIDSEINMLWELMESSYTEEELAVWDAYVEELRTKGDEVVYEDKDFIEPSDGEDSGVLIFELCRPTYANGIQFLNP